MIEVRVQAAQAGRLSRSGEGIGAQQRGSSFVYGSLSDPELALSLTMPVQPQSYDWAYGLLPIFEMNLPEGALRARLERDFAKSLGHVDALDILAITGRHQIGRLEYGPTAAIAATQADQPIGFQSVDEILRARRDGGLFDYLMARYSGKSGISGVQPKVLIQDVGKFSQSRKLSETSPATPREGRSSISLSAATHIVKLWEPSEYPELAANEYFCLMAARAAGLPVPDFTLSDSGEALVIERFDLRLTEAENTIGQGVYLGFEDFCVLNGINVQDKYRGSYEAKLFRRLTDYVDPLYAHRDLAQLFKLFVLNVILRNGDAHLKNFGLTYERVSGSVRLSPVYDIVTTTAYLPADMMALTLGGTTRWPDRAKLDRLGGALCEMSPSTVRETIEACCSAVREIRPAMEHYFKSCPSPDIGLLISEAWGAGLADVG